MPSMFCADCHADLDAVPVDQPCPSCGGGRRSVRVGLPPATAHSSAGEIGVVVRQALDELAAMPVEEARRVVGHLVQVVAHGEGRSEGSATLTVRQGAGVAMTGAALIGPATGVAGTAPALRRVMADPVLGPLVLTALGAALGNLTSDAIKLALGKVLALAAAGQLSVAQPTTPPSVGQGQRPAVMLQGPAPQPPAPPSGAVCLPAHGPKAK